MIRQNGYRLSWNKILNFQPEQEDIGLYCSYQKYGVKQRDRTRRITNAESSCVTLGADRAFSKGYIVRWVEDNICTYRYGEILHASEVLHTLEFATLKCFGYC